MGTQAEAIKEQKSPKSLAENACQLRNQASQPAASLKGAGGLLQVQLKGT